MLAKINKFNVPAFVVAASILLAFLQPVGVVSQESLKRAPGKCPDNYVELSVPLENGHNCIREARGENNPIWTYMRSIIRFLSAGVGIVVVLMIVISGVQYITSGGNPEATQAAKKRLSNAVIALLLFIFMAAILNFLVPGGLL